MGADYKDAAWAYFRYEPSLVAAIVFVVLFFITSALHTYQMFRTRTWYFIPFVIGGWLEMVGYAARCICCEQTPNWTLIPYIIQAIFLLISPALYAASIYMTLGRIIYLLDAEKYSAVRLRWLTKIFVCGDVLSFLMQGGGGGLMGSKKPDMIKVGEHVILGGLFIQVVFFGLFIIVSILFDVRITRAPTERALSPSVPWRKHLNMLYSASALILVRSIVRVVEYIQGNNGIILRHEYYLYIFDALLMWAVMVQFNVIHPSEIKSLLRGGSWSSMFYRIHEGKIAGNSADHSFDEHNMEPVSVRPKY